MIVWWWTGDSGDDGEKLVIVWWWSGDRGVGNGGRPRIVVVSLVIVLVKSLYVYIFQYNRGLFFSPYEFA